MRGFVQITAEVECTLCHRAYEVVCRRSFKRWCWAIKFCGFCGASLEPDASPAEMLERGYEPVPEVEPS